MGKQAFMPGDWKASGPFVRTPLVANSRGGCDGGFSVAAIHPNIKDADAAARLMAAAPELYEALDHLRTVMASHDSTPEEFLALANAVAALAKAAQS